MSKYIKHLTDDEIEKFFSDNGYELTKDLTDPDGNPIDAIERGEEDIFIRAHKAQKDEAQQELEAYLMRKAPHIAALTAIASIRSGYGRNIDLIYFSDYYMSKFCITEDDKKESEELYSSYVDYMVQRFPTYKADIIEYCNSLPDDSQEDSTTPQKSTPPPEQTL